MRPGRKRPPSTARPVRTCGEDLPQDHLRHLPGGQPGAPQHLPDGGGPQLVGRQRRQAAAEGAWADTAGGRELSTGPGRRHPPPGPATHPRRSWRPRRRRRGPRSWRQQRRARSGAQRERSESGRCNRGRSANGAGAGAAPRVLPIPPLSCRRVGRAAAGRGGGRREPGRRDAGRAPGKSGEACPAARPPGRRRRTRTRIASASSSRRRCEKPACPPRAAAHGWGVSPPPGPLPHPGPVQRLRPTLGNSSLFYKTLCYYSAALRRVCLFNGGISRDLCERKKTQENN